jgi:hypothetical protein
MQIEENTGVEQTPARTIAADSFNPYLANPAAIKALSCGQTEPLW